MLRERRRTSSGRRQRRRGRRPRPPPAPSRAPVSLPGAPPPAASRTPPVHGPCPRARAGCAPRRHEGSAVGVGTQKGGPKRGSEGGPPRGGRGRGDLLDPHARHTAAREELLRVVLRVSLQPAEDAAGVLDAPAGD